MNIPYITFNTENINSNIDVNNKRFPGNYLAFLKANVIIKNNIDDIIENIPIIIYEKASYGSS